MNPIERSPRNIDWPKPRWQFVGTLIQLAGMSAAIAMVSGQWISPSAIWIVQPFAIASHLVVAGTVWLLSVDLLNLRRARRELAEFHRGHETTWIFELIDNCLARCPSRRSLSRICECLTDGEQALRHEMQLQAAWRYGLSLTALPLLGFISGFEPLWAGNTDPPPYSELFRPFLFGTVETLLLGAGATALVLQWNRWLDQWCQAAMASFENNLSVEVNKQPMVCATEVVPTKPVNDQIVDSHSINGAPIGKNTAGSEPVLRDDQPGELAPPSDDVFELPPGFMNYG